MNGREALEALERELAKYEDSSIGHTYLNVLECVRAALQSITPGAGESESDTVTITRKEWNRLCRLDHLARKLTEGASHKDEPWDSPHNRALAERGDVIAVSEGDLWALLPFLAALPAMPRGSVCVMNDKLPPVGSGRESWEAYIRRRLRSPGTDDYKELESVCDVLSKRCADAEAERDSLRSANEHLRAALSAGQDKV